MRWIFLTIFALFSCFAWGNEISLKKKLAEAKPESYLVTEQNKTFTLIYVREIKNNTIVLEEVNIPAASFQKKSMSWQEWFENGAPGHTNWVISQINLSTGNFEEVYSFTHQGWIDISHSTPFMSTLLNLRFKEVPENKRRRIGLPPGYGKPDRRPLWNPRLVVNGTTVLNIPFTVWKARWPCDGTELSRKTIEIYLPQKIISPTIPLYPDYFPYWLEVEGKIGSAKIRVVDSGVGIHSPKHSLPHRPPQLIENASLTDAGLTLKLKTPSYFREFILLAEKLDDLFTKTFPLPCITHLTDDKAIVNVPKEELEKWMIPGESYRFIIFPKDDPSICLKTKESLQYH